MIDRQTIIQGYGRAGDDFLAHKLKKVFCELETPEDIALHNDMIRDVMLMVGGDGNELRKSAARIILGRPKDFILKLAGLIRVLSLRNLQDGTKTDE